MVRFLAKQMKTQEFSTDTQTENAIWCLLLLKDIDNVLRRGTFLLFLLSMINIWCLFQPDVEETRSSNNIPPVYFFAWQFFERDGGFFCRLFFWKFCPASSSTLCNHPPTLSALTILFIFRLVFLFFIIWFYMSGHFEGERINTCFGTLVNTASFSGKCAKDGRMSKRMGVRG